jgi:hypothetical protein
MPIDVCFVAEVTTVKATVTYSERNGNPRGRATVRWDCPCGAVIDTGEYGLGQRVNVRDGYCVRCRGCGRVYNHHISLSLIEG